MHPRAQWAVMVVCCTILTIAALVWTGIVVDANWDTFVPDLIIGVVGAAAIGGVLFALQQTTDRRRAREADIAEAYNRLLEALTPLRTLDMASGDASHVSTMRTRLLQLIETVDEGAETSEFASWMNAEGQLCLFRAMQSLDKLRVLDDRRSVEHVLSASEKFHQWVAEFTHNIRFWRTGRMDAATMREQAERIESMLKERGAWRDDEMPWRSAN